METLIDKTKLKNKMTNVTTSQKLNSFFDGASSLEPVQIQELIQIVSDDCENTIEFLKTALSKKLI